MHTKRHLFPGQQEDEEIMLVIRQHWFTLFSKLVFWFLFVIIYFLANWLISDIQIASPYNQIINLVETLYLMFLLLGLFIIWIMWYLNVQVITNHRVVDITQTSLLHHTISELHLNELQDVTGEIKGLFQTFLNFGNVYVQTAGETTRFEFPQVPNPTAVEKLILDLYEKLPPEQKGRP